MTYHVDSFATKTRGGLLRMRRGLVRLERRDVFAATVRIAKISGICPVRLSARPLGEPVRVADGTCATGTGMESSASRSLTWPIGFRSAILRTCVGHLGERMLWSSVLSRCLLTRAILHKYL